MVNRPFLNSQKCQEQQLRAQWEGAHPDILEFRRAFIKRIGKVGVPMFASEIWRSSQRQDQLKADGVSKAGAGNSPHQYGLAVDIVHGVLGWQLDKRQWQLIGHVGKELITQQGFALEWGGDWTTFYDPAHWQVINWRTVKETTWPTQSKRQIRNPNRKLW